MPAAIYASLRFSRRWLREAPGMLGGFAAGNGAAERAVHPVYFSPKLRSAYHVRTTPSRGGRAVVQSSPAAV